MRCRPRVDLVFALLALLPLPTSAQLTVEGRAASLTAGGRFNLQYATTSEDGPAESMFVRRARIEVDASLGDWLEARLVPDFAPGAGLQDAWLRLSFDPAFRVTVGQFKRPFTAMFLASSYDRPVIELDGRIAGLGGCTGVGGVCTFSRLTDELALDGRDTGVLVDGALGDGVGYQASLTNGTGINTGDENSSKSLGGRLAVAATEAVTVGIFAALHDFEVDVPFGDETEYAAAFGADVELGTWRDRLHVQGALVAGENWEAAGRPTFLTAQAIASYYVALENDRVDGVEPLLRLSWADPDRSDSDDEALLVTPGFMVYLLGRNGFSVNLDSYSPSGDTEGGWSLKTQAYVYF